MELIRENFVNYNIDTELDSANKINEENLSNLSFDEETIPDEDFNKKNKKRDKLNSCPNVNLEHKGPNINLKITHKRYSNQKEKELFFEKIKKKKKTELCKNYEFYHDCYYGDNCCFEHGLDELKNNVPLPSYKTKLCKSFTENGICNFGSRCSYKHQIK